MKKYLIAGKENDHKPHLLRKEGALILFYVVILLFFGAYVQSRADRGANFLSAVLPAVLVDLANENRLDHQLPTLRVNPLLVEAARLKAEDMAKKGYFAHNSPEGYSPWYFFQAAGYNYAFAGENLAMDFHDSDAVDSAWMASAGHRANLLNGQFSEIGIAAVEGTINGRKTIFVVQMFGHPRGATVALAQPQTAPPGQIASEPSAADTAEEVIVQSAQDQGEPDKVIAQVEEENEMFIAVSAPEIVSDLSPQAQPLPTAQSSFMKRFLSSPTRILGTLYALLALLVLISISSILMREVRVHHLRHLAYGFSVLLLMAGLLSVFYQLLFSEVLIV